jgi:hypothetical protein
MECPGKSFLSLARGHVESFKAEQQQQQQESRQLHD